MTITPCRVTIDGLIYRFVSGTVARETATADLPHPRHALPAPVNGPTVWRIDAVLSRRGRALHITGNYANARAWDYARRLELTGRIGL